MKPVFDPPIIARMNNPGREARGITGNVKARLRIFTKNI
jgi:hypothetical protein